MDASLRQHEAQHMRADPTSLILWNDIELIQLQVRPEPVYAQQTHRNADQLNDLRPARLCIQCCTSATVSLYPTPPSRFDVWSYRQQSFVGELTVG